MNRNRRVGFTVLAGIGVALTLGATAAEAAGGSGEARAHTKVAAQGAAAADAARHPAGPATPPERHGRPPVHEPDDGRAPYTDGHLPAQWPAEYGITCGSPVADLGDEDLDLKTNVFEAFDPDTLTLPVEIVRTGAFTPDDIVGTPLLVWEQDGVIVDMGIGWPEADYELAEALVDGAWIGGVSAPTYSTCLADTVVPGTLGTIYDNERAAGDYTIRVVFPHAVREDGERVDRLEVGTPFEVTVS